MHARSAEHASPAGSDDSDLHGDTIGGRRLKLPVSVVHTWQQERVPIRANVQCESVRQMVRALDAAGAGSIRPATSASIR